jgi:hypothetical protein
MKSNATVTRPTAVRGDFPRVGIYPRYVRSLAAVAVNTCECEIIEIVTAVLSCNDVVYLEWGGMRGR